MKIGLVILALLFAAGSLSACSARTHDLAARDSAAAQKEISDRTAAFSRAIVDASSLGWPAEAVARIADFYAADTVVFPPRSEPLRGRAALATHWSRSSDRRILWHSAVAERIDVSDDLATEWGTLSIKSQQGEAAPMQAQMTYVSIWVREDGLWRKQMDTWW